jgi:hypothetical protein
MKILVLGFAAGLALAFASAGSALAQVTTYSATVASPSCVGANSCLFTFPAVPTIPGVPDVTGAGTQMLIDPWVNCRIVVSNGGTTVLSVLTYAALGKTSNAAKLFFLSSSSASLYITSPVSYNTINIIDQKAQFFIQAGGSPTITIVTGAISAPNPTLDQPTCSVTGLIH